MTGGLLCFVLLLFFIPLKFWQETPLWCLVAVWFLGAQLTVFIQRICDASLIKAQLAHPPSKIAENMIREGPNNRNSERCSPLGLWSLLLYSVFYTENKAYSGFSEKENYKDTYLHYNKEVKDQDERS